MSAPLRSGSRAENERVATRAEAAAATEQEWATADATDRLEAEHARRSRTRRVLVLVVAAIVAALLPSILPLTPGFSPSETVAAVLAATVTAAVALGVVPLADRLARGLPGAGAGGPLVFAAALFSAGAAAIHFAVAKTHFDEYTLFGVFFVGSGVAQLVWPLWLLFRRWRPLLVLGAVGNGLIVALWAVDRVWGLPLGPTPWKPDPVGFGDSTTSAYEVLVIAICVALLTRGREARLGHGSRVVVTCGVVGVTALSLLSVLGVGSSFLAPTE
jgi:hypothetical protein